MPEPTIFISYSHEDSDWLEKLCKMLRIACQEYGVGIETDEKIKPGDLWESSIEDAIKRSAVAILLISSDSLNSKYICSKELPWIMKTPGIRVIPIIVSACPWNMLSWLEKKQVVPRDGRSLKSLELEPDAVEDVLSEFAIELVKGLCPSGPVKTRFPKSDAVAATRSPATRHRQGAANGNGASRGGRMGAPGYAERDAAASSASRKQPDLGSGVRGRAKAPVSVLGRMVVDQSSFNGSRRRADDGG